MLHSVDCCAEVSDVMIEAFWHHNVESFYLVHGTSSIYQEHFKKYGLSANYPEQLEGMISRIRTLWSNHESDIAPKTGYFRNFERRYDFAVNKEHVCFSFSAQLSITQEYTSGARAGGEWIRELRGFTWRANQKKDLLSSGEMEILAEVGAFIDLLDKAPAMLLKINPSNPAFQKAIFHNSEVLQPLPQFNAFVKQKCLNWKDSARLSHYLNSDLITKLIKEKEKLASDYEFCVTEQVSPENLTYEVLDKKGILILSDDPIRRKHQKIWLEVFGCKERIEVSEGEL